MNTYILSGYNAVGLPGAEVIAAVPGQTLDEALRHMEAPAHVILDAHGRPDGTFQWNEGQWLPYAQLLEALPRQGVASVTLTNCFGESALTEETLRAAPAGTVVHALTGKESDSVFPTAYQFAYEAKGQSSPSDHVIEVFDNFDPTQYRTLVSALNQRDDTAHPADPGLALPHIIGIGGATPQRIDLQERVAQLAAHGETLRGDDAWQEAIRQVQRRFDTVNYHLAYDQIISLGPEEETRLQRSIAATAENLEHGIAPQTAEDRRVAYALATAYLDRSGELEQRRIVALGDGAHTAAEIAPAGELAADATVAPTLDISALFSSPRQR